MSETVAALMFIAIGAPFGALFGIISPVAERSRVALFVSDLIITAAAGAAYVFAAHAFYGGRVEFWSGAVFAAAVFVDYIGVRCATRPVLLAIKTLKIRMAEKRSNPD